MALRMDDLSSALFVSCFSAMVCADAPIRWIIDSALVNDLSLPVSFSTRHLCLCSLSRPLMESLLPPSPLTSGTGLSAWGAAPMWSPVSPGLSIDPVFQGRPHPGYLRLAAPRTDTNVTMALPLLPVSDGLELPFAPGGHTVLGVMVAVNGVELFRWHFPPPSQRVQGSLSSSSFESSSSSSLSSLPLASKTTARVGNAELWMIGKSPHGEEAMDPDMSGGSVLEPRPPSSSLSPSSPPSTIEKQQFPRSNPLALRDRRIMRMSQTTQLTAAVRQLHELSHAQKRHHQLQQQQKRQQQAQEQDERQTWWWLPPPTWIAGPNDTVLFVQTGLQPNTTYSFRTAWILDGQRLGPRSVSQLIRTRSASNSGGFRASALEGEGGRPPGFQRHHLELPVQNTSKLSRHQRNNQPQQQQVTLFGVTGEEANDSSEEQKQHGSWYHQGNSVDSAGQDWGDDDEVVTVLEGLPMDFPTEIASRLPVDR